MVANPAPQVTSRGGVRCIAALTVVTSSSGRRSPASRWASRVRAAIRSADTDEVGLSRS